MTVSRCSKVDVHGIHIRGDSGAKYRKVQRKIIVGRVYSTKRKVSFGSQTHLKCPLLVDHKTFSALLKMEYSKPSGIGLVLRVTIQDFISFM